MPQMFNVGGVLVLGDVEKLSDVEDTETWLATTDPMEVRR